MKLWLRVAYPFFVILWAVLSVATNKRAVQRNLKHRSMRLKLDGKVPFISGFAIPYFSSYILVNMAFFILNSRDCFPRVCLGYVTLFVIGGFIYILYPCRVDRQEEIEKTSVPTYLLAAFQRASPPFNSFPSMHVGYSLFNALAVLHYDGAGVGIALLVWTGLVAVSTLLTKQHHILDVIAGAALAVAAFLIARL